MSKSRPLQKKLKKGVKFDYGKPEFALIPPNAEEELAIILTMGAQKYDRENWRKVPDGIYRYFNAARRHLNQYARGEMIDRESGRHHLGHAICNLFFLYELEFLKAKSSK